MTPPGASEQSGDGGDEDEPAEPFSIGTHVVDREDPDPNLAVVINRPPVACDDWVAYHTPERGDVTVADDNPDYDPEAEAIVVAFREEFREAHPEWHPEDGPFTLDESKVATYAFPPGRLEIVDEEWPDEPGDDGTDDQEDNARMAKITPGDPTIDDEADDEDDEGDDDEADGDEADDDEAAEPEPPEVDGAMADLRDRLAESATVEVERGDDGEAVLAVSKLGDSYQVRPDGTIDGEGVLRDRLDDLVEEYL